MNMVEVAAQTNGGHRNQTCHGTVPAGWALIPEGMELPNFPFGQVTAEEVEGVLTLTGWVPGEVPVGEEPPLTLNDRVAALESAVQTGLKLYEEEMQNG